MTKMTSSGAQKSQSWKIGKQTM